MSNDSGDLEPRQPRPDHDLPRVKSVQSRTTRFTPRRRNFTSALPELDYCVEFLVETDSPIPVRALGPVLHVGDVVLTEVEVYDETHYGFLALGPEKLDLNAPVTLGWSGLRPA
ncbi:hypothetical protein IU479_26915 [Nocardia abscessus]|uniref:hypothetical protein n=1 Tax=Nocardia abscessus TaxID=120957 RepID=UPI001895CA0F|nr:hypothetical protein [Nocardia abscessus]MBF6221736.1 hypothetical protein [Nocardia abscessus]